MNYYEILQIKIDSSGAEIKQAYRNLAKQFHPDSQHKNANHEQIIKLNAAYEVLNDPKKRYIYDQKIKQKNHNLIENRQNKSYHASQYYRQDKENRRKKEHLQFHWLKDVYFPINTLIDSIILSLEKEIEDLSADVFDDELMSIFTNYLENCRRGFEMAKKILASQPNPSLYGGIAANLYYGLNHISDGIEELERFTLTYDDYYLHTGRELFNLAEEISQSAADMVERFI
ncbi:MAG: J domain-containing protein [Cyanobacteria bacterium]|nr:J domain-containing protein [Cyanobacteria bacterium CG_2015-16_32_12]NCO77487.1 J domain-containing protein [Cyanobacteria bacterium CG_2015-22_32_23]NCQ04162.1 J domain-containing protein [Cyanobacteria bacterium CG_2015-09_32_10]NCQ42559.1 J domain-containing protein [Cyanobacteria bacterium CG_2015-04_32_10]NCS84137.1 J domain-containing protein [Cyanobacteria bacterium CG_2015-02_32_10]